MAATLACGPHAILSHGSAAALWGIGSEQKGLIEITLRVFSARKRPGIRTYRRPGLQERDVALLSNIPVTGIVRTLVDLATQLSSVRLERAINEADRLGLIDPESLRGELEGYSRQRGVARLREVLDRRTFRLTDSELERRFLRLVRDVGLAMPLTRQRLNGFRVDFYWPDLRLVVETDGLKYHRTPAQQARDRVRDQAHTAAGLTHLRFTYAQVRFEAGYVRSTLMAVARRLESAQEARRSRP
jgi:very-short-patch-repair endonuclease